MLDPAREQSGMHARAGPRPRLECAAAALLLGVTVALIALVAPFRAHMKTRALAATRARYYLSLPVCTDAGVVAQLGPLNLCDSAAAVLASPPWLGAVTDTARDVLAPVVASVPRAAWVLAALGAVVLASWVWNTARMTPARQWQPASAPPKWAACSEA